MKSWVRIVVVLSATIALMAPSANGIVLETLGFGAAGIIKGSLVATAQSAAAAGGGYIGTGLLGFGSTGIAKGSIVAGLQSAAASGAGIGVGAAALPVVAVGGALLVGAVAYGKLGKKTDGTGTLGSSPVGIAKGPSSTEVMFLRAAVVSRTGNEMLKKAAVNGALLVGVAAAGYRALRKKTD